MERFKCLCFKWVFAKTSKLQIRGVTVSSEPEVESVCVSSVCVSKAKQANANCIQIGLIVNHRWNPGKGVCGPNQTLTSNCAEFFDRLTLVVIVVVMMKMVVVLLMITLMLVAVLVVLLMMKMVDDDDDDFDVDGDGGHLLERDVSDRNPLSWS